MRSGHDPRQEEPPIIRHRSAGVRSKLLKEYDIEIGAGLGALKGKVWRIGLMGASSTRNHVNALCGALGELLKN